MERRKRTSRTCMDKTIAIGRNVEETVSIMIVEEERERSDAGAWSEKKNNICIAEGPPGRWGKEGRSRRIAANDLRWNADEK